MTYPVAKQDISIQTNQNIKKTYLRDTHPKQETVTNHFHEIHGAYFTEIKHNLAEIHVSKEKHHALALSTNKDTANNKNRARTKFSNRVLLY